MNNTVLSQLARLETERMKGYKELLDFYYGKQWDARGRKNERRLTFNYARVFIEKVTSYLMGGMNFAVDPVEDSDEARNHASRAEAALKKVYSENHLEQLDLETEMDCAVLGDGCYKVIWDATEKQIRVTAPDVQGIYAWSAGDDTSRLWRVAARYQLLQEEVEYLYGVKPQNKKAVVVELWTERDFELYLDNKLLEAKTNPYGFIPFVIFPNLREPKKFWGISDLLQIMESQRELNRAMSQLSRILELSGNPIAVLENVEESEDIAVKPGAVWNIPEDAKAYLLDLLQGGGVNLHINYIDLIYRAMHDLSESPRSAFGGVERDMSGVALEHATEGGRASLILRAHDGWRTLHEWSARQQMRWNKSTSEKSVKEIIAVILARAGLKLEAKSQSSAITGFYPDFTVYPNESGKNAIEKLLSLVPDVIFIEGNKAYLINPQLGDSTDYSYGVDHVILEGRYRQGAMSINRAQVEGYDTGQSKMIVIDSLDWGEIERLYDRMKHVEDRNLNTVAQACQRGEALLRKSAIDAVQGMIIVPVNCGQQLYDVIEITDSVSGLDEAKRRILGITLVYQPRRGEYFQRLEIGGV